MSMYVTTESGTTYPCIVLDTGEVAFTRRTLARMIEAGDGEDGNGEGMALGPGDTIIDTANGIVSTVPTVVGTGQTLYVLQGRVWDLLSPRSALAMVVADLDEDDPLRAPALDALDADLS